MPSIEHNKLECNYQHQQYSQLQKLQITPLASLLNTQMTAREVD
jgi:hypothetical protein